MKTMKYLLPLVLSSSILGGCSSTPSSSDSSSKADTYTQLGAAYLQKGRFDLAKLNLEKALAENSSSADVHHYYALLEEHLGDDGQASKHFQMALSLDGKNPELLNNYGSYLCKTGHYAAAEHSFLGAVSDPLYKTPEFAYTNAGLCMGKLGKNEQAESYFRQALQVNRNFAEALYQMAKLNHERGDNPKAQAFLYRYNDNGTPTPDSLSLCYQIESQLNDAAKAGACMADLRTKFPESAPAN